MKLGGSTIAAACGIDPWQSRVELYYRLTGRIEDDQSEPAYWGQKVEPLIFDALRERGLEVHPTPGVELVDPDYPWLVGHPDGLAAGNVVVEAKLTGAFAYSNVDALPLAWVAQVQTYCRLGRMEQALVAVLHSGTRLSLHRLTYDDRAASMLLELAAEFWEYVERREPPPPDGSESAAKALAAAFPQPDPQRVYRLTGAEWDLVEQLRQRRRQLAAVEAQVRELESRIKASDPEAERYIGPQDEPVATWKASTSKRVDVKRLKAEAPHVAEQYANETTNRRFVFHD
jgi:predicted phage-related endonuclease